MSEFGKESQIIHRLEKRINAGIRVFIMDTSDHELTVLLCRKLKKQNIHDVEIWQCFEKECEDSHLIYISEKEMDDILGLYRLYDFSDRLYVITDPTQYGSMYNFVITGLLTKDEMADALLYKLQNDPEIP